jgi:hypothetical protein
MSKAICLSQGETRPGRAHPACYGISPWDPDRPRSRVVNGVRYIPTTVALGEPFPPETPRWIVPAVQDQIERTA